MNTSVVLCKHIDLAANTVEARLYSYSVLHALRRPEGSLITPDTTVVVAVAVFRSLSDITRISQYFTFLIR